MLSLSGTTHFVPLGSERVKLLMTICPEEAMIRRFKAKSSVGIPGEMDHFPDDWNSNGRNEDEQVSASILIAFVTKEEFTARVWNGDGQNSYRIVCGRRAESAIGPRSGHTL